MTAPGSARSVALLHRTFFRVREPAFWVFVVLLGIGGVTTLRTLADLATVSRSGWALAWLLLALYASPVIVLVYRLDLYEREPLPLAAAAFAWGALGATGLSIDAAGWNDALITAAGPGAADVWIPAVLTPVVEEVLKGAGIVLLALIAADEFDDMLDGLVYGALVGLGFAVVEDVVYFMAVFGGTPAGVLEGFALRVLASGLYGHVLYTSLVGMAIGYVVTRRGDVPAERRFATAAVLVAVAVAAHVAWNLPALNPDLPEGTAGAVLAPLVLAVKGVPLLVFVALTVAMAHRRERRWLDAALRTETDPEVVSREELELLRDAGARHRARRTMRARAGRRAATLLQRLQREQVNLAMVLEKAPGDAAAIEGHRHTCRSLRLALEAIPGAAAAGDLG